MTRREWYVHVAYQNDVLLTAVLAVFAVVAFWPRFGPGAEPQPETVPREGVPIDS